MSNSNTPRCNYDAENGPCQRKVKDGGLCPFHDDEVDVSDDHGGQEGNLNAMQHGLNVDRRRCLKGFGPGHELLMIELYEQYLEQSVFDFDTELRFYRTFDWEELLDAGVDPFFVQECAPIDLHIAVPQKHISQANYLFNAAVDLVKALRINAILAAEDITTEKIVGSKYIEDKEEWVEIRELQTHYLDLPYHRLVRSTSELLEKGGVPKVLPA